MTNKNKVNIGTVNVDTTTTASLSHSIVANIGTDWETRKGFWYRFQDMAAKDVLLLDFFKSVEVHQWKHSHPVKINSEWRMTEAQKHSDFLCKIYILKSLQDDIYNKYNNINTLKEFGMLWKKRTK